MTTTSPIQRSYDSELQDWHAPYIWAIGDGRFEELPDSCTPDATYEILPRENVNQGLPAGVMLCFSQAMMRDRVVSMREANVFHAHTYRHFVSAFEILDQIGRASCRDRVFQ